MGSREGVQRGAGKLLRVIGMFIVLVKDIRSNIDQILFCNSLPLCCGEKLEGVPRLEPLRPVKS